MTIDPNDIKPGDTVVTWSGLDDAEPSPAQTVERVTKTLIITSDGARWGRETRIKVGNKSPWALRLYLADDPRLAVAAERRAAKARREEVGGAMKFALHFWARNPTEERTADLRAAIVEAAPLLGLTVTVDADQCRHECDGQPCLLPAGHVAAGEWHKGLGWTTSLAWED